MSVINEITVENTTYDVQDLISRPILTLAQYKALEEAHLIDPNIDYHISDGLSVCVPIDDDNVSTEKVWSSKKVSESQALYSVDEQVVGTWHDGKPIYRKIITDTMPSSGVSFPPSSASTNVKNVSIDASIDTFVSITGYYIYNGNYDNLGQVITNIMWSSIWGRNNGSSTPNSLGILCGTSAVGLPCTIIVEYTKTTDPTPS